MAATWPLHGHYAGGARRCLQVGRIGVVCDERLDVSSPVVRPPLDPAVGRGDVEEAAEAEMEGKGEEGGEERGD